MKDPASPEGETDQLTRRPVTSLSPLPSPPVERSIVRVFTRGPAAPTVPSRLAELPRRPAIEN
jgi:hypothetical protein